MGARDTFDSRLRRRIPAWVDAVTYALVVGGLLTLAALVATLVTGGDLVRVKLMLFFGGWILLAIAAAMLWPDRSTLTSAGETDSKGTSVGRDGRIQRLSSDIPPARWVREPTPHERISRGGKLFWAALVTLAISFLLETVFGVA